MTRRYWMAGVSALALAALSAMPVQAQSTSTKARTTFDWSQSYVAGSLGGVQLGEMPATAVDDKFGTLGRKQQSGLLLAAEYGRLLDAQHDIRVTLRAVSMPEHIVDAAGFSGLSYGRAKLGYETLDVDVGRRVMLSDPLALRLFAGIRGMHVRDQLDEQILGASNQLQVAKAETWGAGPRAGAEFAWRLATQPVFLVGGVDGSVVFGQTAREVTFNDFDLPLNASASGTSATTQYSLGGYLGLTWIASPATALTLGYQAEHIWNLRNAYSDIVASRLGTIDGRSNNLVHGAYARVVMHLHPYGPMTATDRPSQAEWTGLRIGLDGGNGFSIVNADNALSSAMASTFSGGGNLEGAMAGGHIGYDWRHGALLAGIEGDVMFGELKGLGLITSAQTVAFQADWLASVRARLGWVRESALIYVTGGAAWASARGTLSDTGVEVASERHGYQGWVLGAGLDYHIDPRWSLRAEYLHYDLGAQHYALTAPSASYSADMGLRTDMMRVGLTYTLPAGR